MALAWAFYWEASHAAGAHDVPPFDWFGLYCGYSI